jgi:hypothetical protein
VGCTNVGMRLLHVFGAVQAVGSIALVRDQPKHKHDALKSAR